eukprot:6211907-Pleurochrysis_carterae.AAC.2
MAQVKNVCRLIVDPHERESLEGSGHPDIVSLEQLVDEVHACVCVRVDHWCLSSSACSLNQTSFRINA